MRAVGRFLGYVVIILLLPGVGLWAVGPFEPAPLKPSVEVALGDDLDAYFASIESSFDDITPGTEKRVIWAGTPGTRTEWVVLYVHGFSATSEEIRPVPDRLADALGAKLIYTRLQGHVRGSDAFAEGTVQGWVNDFSEAMQVAHAEADQVVRPDITAEIAAAWGGPSATVNPVTGEGDDVQSHVIAGAVLSPGQTDAAVAGMSDWVAGLE